MVKKNTVRGFSPARKFAWNKEAEIGGLWRDIEDGAAQLKIARFNNPEHTAFLRQVREENLKLIEVGGKEADEFLTDLGNKAMSKYILTDWKGIQDADGNEVEYSADVAYEMMTAYPEFSELVFSLSLDTERYRLYQEDKAAKN